MSEWISIKDTFKLPETEKTILVYSERTGYVLGRFSHYREFITNNGCPMSISYLFDVHAYWCYLPEPPKE